MNLERIAVKQSSEVPHRVTGCLRALGVKFTPGRNFWLRNEGELEWLLKDAHNAWREKIKVSHTDVGGTHAEAARWNMIWDRVKKLFLDKGVSLDERKALPEQKEIEPKKKMGRPSMFTPAERLERRRTKEGVRTRNWYRTKVGIPLDLPTFPRGQRWKGPRLAIAAMLACVFVLAGCTSVQKPSPRKIAPAELSRITPPTRAKSSAPAATIADVITQPSSPHGVVFEYPAAEVTNVIFSVQRRQSFDANGFWEDVVTFRVLFVEPENKGFYRVGAGP